MPLLRVELKPDALWFVNPLLGLSFSNRVEAFHRSFDGFPAYKVTCGVALAGLAGAAGAVTYLSAPDNVTADKLAGLQRQWTDRVTGIRVTDLRVVGNCGDTDADRRALESQTVTGRLGSVLGAPLEWLKLALVVAVAVYVFSRLRK